MLSKYGTLLLDDVNYNEFDSYREEYIFLNEMKSEGKKKSNLADKAGKSAQKVIKKTDNVAVTLGKAIKALYSTNDEHLVEGTMELSKIITRFAVLAAGAYVFPAGLFVSGLVGVIGHFTGLALRRSNDAKRREKLMQMYKAKLEFVEDKIPKVEDDKQKQSLLKLKHKLNADIEKLGKSVLGDE
jgi:hypothetical protein